MFRVYLLKYTVVGCLQWLNTHPYAYGKVIWPLIDIFHAMTSFVAVVSVLLWSVFEVFLPKLTMFTPTVAINSTTMTKHLQPEVDIPLLWCIKDASMPHFVTKEG